MHAAGYGALMATTAATRTAGDLLREWRQRRRLTQMDLGLAAGVSTRHLSFVETGRASPSREMLLHLCEHLDVPLRERNTLLVAAGYAPSYHERDLASPEMRPVREALDRLLTAHNPYPAVVVDRWWNLVAANDSVGVLVEGVAPELMAPQFNVLRASLHPDGLARRIRNLGEWRSHVLTRLREQVERTGDPQLAGLLDEIEGYPAPPSPPAVFSYDGVAVPLRLATPSGDLNLLSTIATFGTPLDVTVSDLSIEAFYPADEATRQRLQSAPG